MDGLAMDGEHAIAMVGPARGGIANASVFSPVGVVDASVSAAACVSTGNGGVSRRYLWAQRRFGVQSPHNPVVHTYLRLTHHARGGDDITLVIHERADNQDDEAGELQKRVLVESLSQPGGREVEETAVHDPHKHGALSSKPRRPRHCRAERRVLKLRRK